MITSAGSGFGLEAARRCVASGMRVALLDVSEESLQMAEWSLKQQAAAATDRSNVASRLLRTAPPRSKRWRPPSQR